MRRLVALIVVGAVIIGGVTYALVRVQTGELEERIFDKGRLFSSILGAHLGRIAGENIRAYDKLQAAAAAIGREHESVLDVRVIAPEYVILASRSGKNVWEPVGPPDLVSVQDVVKSGAAKSVVRAAMGRDLVGHFIPIFETGSSGVLIGVLQVTVEFPSEQGRVQSVRSNRSAYFRTEAAGFGDELAGRLRSVMEVAHRNFTYIDELVAQMSTDDDIEDVRVFAGDLRGIGSSSGGRSFGFITSEETALFRDVMNGGTEMSVTIEGPDGGRVELASPLYLSDGARRQVGGAVGITLSLDRMRNLAAGRRNLILAMSVVTFVAFCLMVGLVYKARSQREIQEWSGTLQKRVDEVTRELEKKQAQLLESEKLAGLGVLSSGLAHEINNPLGVVLGDSQMLLEELKERGGTGDVEETRAMLEAIERNAKRCSQIVKNLLQFASGGKMELEDIRVGEVLERAVAAVSKDCGGKAIEIEKRIDEGLPSLRANRVQLEQVFENIVKNAVQSIGDDGRVSVSARQERCDEDEHDVVAVRFEDTGSGIPADDLGKIFEPFFTTKEPGDGVGLGLSVSYGIIQAHGGNIQVTSESGKGTAVVVTLPCSRKG